MSISSITTPAAATVDKGVELTCARPNPEQEAAISTSFKMVAFHQPSSARYTSFNMEDFDINEIYDLEDTIPKTQTFAQDDCLHTERVPLRLSSCRSPQPGRARYNFQQGLVNTKEVLETEEFRGNPNMAADKIS